MSTTETLETVESYQVALQRTLEILKVLVLGESFHEGPGTGFTFRTPTPAPTFSEEALDTMRMEANVELMRHWWSKDNRYRWHPVQVLIERESHDSLWLKVSVRLYCSFQHLQRKSAARMALKKRRQ